MTCKVRSTVKVDWQRPRHETIHASGHPASRVLSVTSGVIYDLTLAPVMILKLSEHYV